ncbi:HAMP domain-containing protein [Acinetobacter rongchengensis]|uniref:Sensor protein n=2 Tax=Acinetobacter rongchengensis TaxID=2419601 RepID=A0A3A8F9W9_9GAMM|nr:HAMP domain-containing protein [Acinetobacter rongchengensis]
MSMLKKYFNSISNKLKFAIIIWLVGALFFVGLTLNIIWKLEDRGIAINEAGSLRKQAYYMVAMVQAKQTTKLPQEIQLFENKLKHLSLLETQTYWFHSNDQYLFQLNQVKDEFSKYKIKILQAESNLNTQPNLVADTILFIQHIDNLVKSIEKQNTLNIKIMRIAQILLMLMAIISAFLSLFLLNRLVIQPLSLLSIGFEKIKKGELDTRLNIQTNDEFHQVSNGFNQMVTSLQDLYQHLEDKVTQKTIDLKSSNDKLTTLYEMTDFLHKNPYNEQTLNLFLEKITTLAHAKTSSIRLLNQQGSQMWTIQSINIPDILLQNPACAETTACLCGQALNQADLKINLLQQDHQKYVCKKLGMDHLMVYHIRLREQTLGLLTLYFEKPSTQTDSNSSLIQLLCNQLATAIENNRLILKEKQYAVLEERNIMAQGLHDSIAQSLSFMNIQHQMLNQAWKKQQYDKVEQHLNFLQTGLQQCYEDIRELLNNFRFKLAQESFQDILFSVIERFKNQTQIQVNFTYQSSGVDLTPQQQLQLIFILQEALSNIRKHASASLVTVHFNNDQEIFLKIQDNGIGFDTTLSKEYQGHHIGLSIMQERIHQIGGQLKINSILNQGTCIEATINHNNQLEENHAHY